MRDLVSTWAQRVGMMVGMNASAPVPMLFISAANLLGIGRSKRSRENSRRRRNIGRAARRARNAERAKA